MLNRTQRPEPGFTLIELLIVVAIIAILAAIAVPNFLEAQTRSKVSRAKADMRTLSVATEAYAVDNNKYPIAADELGQPILPYPVAGPEVFETRVSTVLTTPIAYLTSLLNEPFSAPGTAENPQFHYGTRAYALLQEGPEGTEEYDEYIAELALNTLSTEYFILSHGPDLDHDGPGEHDHAHEGGVAAGAQEPDEDHDHDDEGEGPALYDPTNGTISNGDIAYFGPGIGFRN